ncbi:MAG TPA: sigma-70 family RNA polymerase sigma factor [Candidatus Acidoferrales bacterium]|jgi:RNA polymerase sigma factor (sigma-70 family)|nr:sigma-70 family RNA polymerase sigma factor [Candidatus Acidoferrales bacterium]
MTVTDLDLLRQYATDGSQAAFTALVQRHVNLVYSAALRQIRSPHLAEEITQSVFSDLARDAGKLMKAPGDSPVLTAWLYQVARRTAIDVIRQESRRQLREQVAVEMNLMNATAADWTHIEPLLDDAMAALNQTDRTAILLRYFENKSLTEVGAALGTSDDAAQKRVSRAIDQLREFFDKRKVTVGASGLAVLISANAVQSAPAGLVATITTTALAGTAVATSAVIAATKTIAMTTLQKTLVAASLAVLVGTGIYQAHTTSALRHQVQDLQQQQAPLAAQISQLQNERDAATNQLATLADENKKLGQNSAELLKLRGQVARLQSEKNLGQAKARLADAPAGMNVIAYASDQERRSGTNAITGQVHAMATKLGLTPDQEQSMRNIMLGNVDARVVLDIREGGGDLTHEDAQLQYKNLADHENQALASVLTPDEMTAYQQLKADQATANQNAWAKHEAAVMTKSLNLTPDQAAQAVTILTSLPPGEGGPGFTAFTNAPQQLDLRLNAFAPILTAEQLATYRQQKLADMEQTAAEKQMAQQAYKSLTK